MKKTLIFTIMILLIGLVWWGCENEVSPTEPTTSFNIQDPDFGINAVTLNGGCVPPPDGMVGWWTGDNTADDYLGNYNGTLMGDETYGSGKVDQAFSFDGDGDFVEVGYYNTPTNAITIDCWLYISQPTLFPSIVSKGDVGNYDESFAIYLNNYTVNFLINNNGNPDGSGRGYLFGPAIPPLTWTHIAVTWDGTTMHLYVNGVSVTNALWSGPIYETTTWPVFIGKSHRDTHSYGTTYINGMVDEVEIFDRALTPGEIQSIYDADVNGKCKVIEVEIDIKPGSDPNSVNCQDNEDNGVIPVAILTTEVFDALTVNANTVIFGDGAMEIHDVKKTDEAKRHEEDVDGDGDIDLMFHFRSGDTGIDCGDTEAILSGYTYGGTPILGSDYIQTVPTP